MDEYEIAESLSGEMAKIGVAISGGGHRAALFGLGVLLYLADAGKNKDVATIASVSGGSLANAWLGLRTGYEQVDGDEFWGIAKPFASQLARRGTLFASLVTWIYLALLVAGLGVTIWILFWPASLVVRLATFIGALLAWFFVASRRSEVAGVAFGRTLFKTGLLSVAKLNEVSQSINHVICATDLHDARHLYFSGGFVGSYSRGLGVPGNLRLHAAVQASAAFPFAFSPRIMRTSRHEFEEAARQRSRLMFLSDGGVYNNMAEQWILDVARRKQRWPSVADQLHEPDQAVVVNASPNRVWSRLGRVALPAVGELYGVYEVINGLYENTTRKRRQSLVEQFDRAAQTGEGIIGALIMIDQTPYVVPDYFRREEVGNAWPDRKARADTVIESFGGDDSSRAAWRAVTELSKTTKTTLSRLGVARSANLIRHGYATAMANLHVLLDYPICPLPDDSEFRKLCGKET